MKQNLDRLSKLTALIALALLPGGALGIGAARAGAILTSEPFNLSTPQAVIAASIAALLGRLITALVPGNRLNRHGFPVAAVLLALVFAIGGAATAPLMFALFGVFLVLERNSGRPETAALYLLGFTAAFIPAATLGTGTEVLSAAGFAALPTLVFSVRKSGRGARMLALAAAIIASGLLFHRRALPVASPPPPAAGTLALPASLLPETGSRRIRVLWLASTPDGGELTLAALPYTLEVDLVLWSDLAKMPSSRLQGHYDLVFIRDFDRASPRMRRERLNFGAAATANGGVLVLPRTARSRFDSLPLLPEKFGSAVELPWSGGRYIAASSRMDLISDIEHLDDKLSAMQRCDGFEVLPPGMLAALFPAKTESVHFPREKLPVPPPPGWMLAALIALYGAIRFLLARQATTATPAERVENGAATMLVLTVAAELAGAGDAAVEPTALLGLAAAAMITLPLKPEPGWLLPPISCAAPLVWLWPAAAQSTVITAAIAIAATLGAVQINGRQLHNTRSVSKFADIQLLAGFILGVGIYLCCERCFPGSVAVPAAAAALLRLPALLSL